MVEHQNVILNIIRSLEPNWLLVLDKLKRLRFIATQAQAGHGIIHVKWLNALLTTSTLACPQQMSAPKMSTKSIMETEWIMLMVWFALKWSELMRVRTQRTRQVECLPSFPCLRIVSTRIIRIDLCLMESWAYAIRMKCRDLSSWTNYINKANLSATCSLSFHL